MDGTCQKGDCVVQPKAFTALPSAAPSKSPVSFVDTSTSPTHFHEKNFIQPPSPILCADLLKKEECSKWSGCIWLSQFNMCKVNAAS